VARLASLPSRGRTFVAGFESTHLPGVGLDLFDITGHADRWRDDIAAVLAVGVRHFRYPLRWPRIEPASGEFDWRETDEVLGHLHDVGAVPIVDLVHHTSYPRWLTDGFRDRAFRPAYLRYAEAVARRYPWIPAYTLFNEPFATLFLSGHEGLWPPYDRGMDGLVRALRSVLPAVSEAGRCFADLLPEAAHVWVDTAEHHRGVDATADYVAFANDRRHCAFDLITGHDVDVRRPFLRALAAAGGESLLALPPLRVDVLGLDYYCHSEWFYDESGGSAPSPEPIGLAAVAQLYGERYKVPMMLTETNIRGLPTDRVAWLKYTLEQYELALARGVDLRGFCWFPQVDSCDWDSLLARGAGRVDPVGVVSLTPDHEPVRTVFTDWWERAARGLPVADIPAYRLQEPCATQLRGLSAAVAHWHLEEPPVAEVVPPQWVSRSVIERSY
jgi:beta-glucosidase/6-phospho-beta-glucosidase/beta-galactosidase